MDGPTLVILLFPVCIALLIVVNFRAWRSRRQAQLQAVRVAMGCCRICGYDLRGSPALCPECGTVPEIPTNQRYTDRARRIVALARNAVPYAGEFVLVPERILAAIAAEGRGVGAALLRAMNADCAALASRLAPGLSATETPRGGASIGAQCDELLRAAWSEARSIGDDYVGTQHLLLAMLADPQLLPADLCAGTQVGHRLGRRTLMRWRVNWELDAGRTASALRSCDELLSEPTADLLNLKAWALATTVEPSFYRPAEALELAKRACDLTQYTNAGCLDTLAVCEAGCGNFTEAIRLMQSAIPNAPDAQKEACESRLALFREGKPYRESPVSPIPKAV